MILTNKNNEYSDQEIARRRDEALRRALNSPPKQHKDMKKGKSRKRQDDHPTASEKRT
jgi:hypothetical protein